MEFSRIYCEVTKAMYVTAPLTYVSAYRNTGRIHNKLINTITNL